MPHDKGWKAQRRIIRQGLNPTTLKEYGLIQEDLAVLLGKQLLDDPAGFVSHVRLWVRSSNPHRISLTFSYSVTSRTISSITYGLPVAEADTDVSSHGLCVCDA